MPYDEHVNDTKVHFLIVGTAGSGKTTALHLLSKSILVPRNSVGHIGVVHPDPTPYQSKFPLRFRALITDPKNENLPKMHGWGIPKDAIIITNPFDARCSGWDISGDLDTHVKRDQFVKEIINMDPVNLSGAVRDAGSRVWDRIANACLTPVMDALAEGAFPFS
ncbi:type IV secretion system DNA-binding domain-containing protein [Stieleria neptunia]|nr:type IV secretion system DNA-binding domain-containing protein [Stieleria neptunia]